MNAGVSPWKGIHEISHSLFNSSMANTQANNENNKKKMRVFNIEDNNGLPGESSQINFKEISPSKRQPATKKIASDKMKIENYIITDKNFEVFFPFFENVKKLEI